MAGFQDGHKLKGRFIKHGSKVLDHVALEDFSFREISESPVVSHDNTDSSIIHTKYHRSEDIALAVKSPPKFDQNLMNDAQIRPVLQPLDFTASWRRDQKRQKEGSAQANGEDELVYDDFESAYAEEVASQRRIKNRAAAEEAAKAKFVAVEAEKAGDPTRPRSEFESIDFAGEVIKGMHVEKASPHENDSRVNGPSDNTHVVEEDPVDQEMEARHEEPQVQSAQAHSDEFIPTAAGTGAAPEKAAADEYKQRLQTQQRSAELVLEEAKSQGYEEGFKLGEEKAAFQARAQAQAIFSKLGELFHEFGNLKKEVLNNVQQNFFEISQAIAESVLKKEFEMNPQAFASVVRRAIDDSVEADKFKVRVHPDTYESLQGLGVESMLSNMVRDEKIERGEFKIESDLSVVDGSISKLVRELLDRADLNLFDEEKAS